MRQSCVISEFLGFHFVNCHQLPLLCKSSDHTHTHTQKEEEGSLTLFGLWMRERLRMKIATSGINEVQPHLRICAVISPILYLMTCLFTKDETGLQVLQCDLFEHTVIN